MAMRIRIPALVSRFKQFRLAVCATLCLLVGLPPLASAQSYSFKELSPLSGLNHSEAEGINNAGQVVGRSFTPHFGVRATLWNGTDPTDLGFGEAYAINNSGQVVGWSGDRRATLWNGTTPTELGILPGGYTSIAYQINDRGQVVGNTLKLFEAALHATL